MSIACKKPVHATAVGVACAEPAHAVASSHSRVKLVSLLTAQSIVALMGHVTIPVANAPVLDCGPVQLALCASVQVIALDMERVLQEGLVYAILSGTGKTVQNISAVGAV